MQLNLKVKTIYYYFLIISMSGKMHIKYANDNKPDVAYIIKQEGRNKLHILTENKCVGTCSKPKYCKDSNVCRWFSIK